MRRGTLLVLACLLVISGCASTSEQISDESTAAPAGAKSTGNFAPKLSNAFEQDWPMEVSREELIETALYKLFRDLDQIRNDECEVRPLIFTSDPFLDEHLPLLETIAEGMVHSFCNYLTDDIPVIAGRYDYLKEVLASEGLPTDDYGGNCGNEVIQDFASGCAAFGSVWTGIQLGSLRSGQPFVEERRLTIAAHEIMHNIHDQINPRGEPGLGSCRGSVNFSCAGPVWLYEGAGEFFGRAMTQYLGLQNYATFVPNDRNGYYLAGEYLSDLDFLTTRRNKAFGVENYYSGQIVMELLIANKGLIPVLGIWENLDRGLPFPQAFQDSIGLDLEAFYSLFETFHNRIYSEAGYCEGPIGCDPWTPPSALPDWYAQSPNAGEPEGSEDRGGLTDRNLDEACLVANEIWWSKCTELEYGIPVDPENSDHGYPLGYTEIAKIESCDEMTMIGFNLDGWAVSFDAKEAASASNAQVSTQYYAALRYLDTNMDGVLCSSQAPD